MFYTELASFDGAYMRIVGREREIERLEAINKRAQATILIVHGRRRVGKTVLIEKVYQTRNLLKIEGIESQNTRYQIKSAVKQLTHKLPEKGVSNWNPKSWHDFFSLLVPILKTGRWTLYLEEFQWLACYRDQLAAEFKYWWDNYLRHNPKLLVIFCGSSPSFMINHVLHSQALYNRSQEELQVQPLPLADAAKFFRNSTSKREIMDGYLLAGGIPLYLKALTDKSSVYLSLLRMSLEPEGLYVTEEQKILISSFAKNLNYSKIIKLLANKAYATRQQISKFIKQNSGGGITSLLFDLEQCGFIERSVPIDKPTRSTIARYSIKDAYLRFYYQFIEPRWKEIRRGDFRDIPPHALPLEKLTQWLAYGFEDFCRYNSKKIAAILGFSGIEYRAGPYFERVVKGKQAGFQIDLVFLRKDRVNTLVEIKYTDSPVGPEVVAEFAKKEALFRQKHSASIQRVLISAAGITSQLEQKHFFDRVITLDELLA